MKKRESEQTIVRIVDQNTTETQLATATSHTIMQIATRDGLTLLEANTALNGAVEDGLIIEEDGGTASRDEQRRRRPSVEDQRVS